MKIILSLTCLFICISSCTQSREEINAEFSEIAQKIKNDQNHAYFRTFIPTKEDCRAVFESDSIADQVYEYCVKKFGDINLLPDDRMKPFSMDDEIVILYASKEELLNNTTNGLNDNYLNYAHLLKDEVTLYGFFYVNKKGQEKRIKTGFFKLSDKWIFIPSLWMAFY